MFLENLNIYLAKKSQYQLWIPIVVIGIKADKRKKQILLYT